MVINNGHLSESFQIKQGVRQGCPLSSSLFIICLELLSNCIDKNDDICGIKIDNVEIKKTFFADDAIFFNNKAQ